jgi:hypothetical protein
LAEAIEELKRDVRLYADAIALYASIRLYFLNDHKITVYVEPTVKVGEKGDPKVPDLLVRTQTGWTVLEHKGSLPRDQDTIANKIEQLSEYNKKTSFEGSVFQPAVALLCPRRLAKDLMLQKDQLKLPTIISYSSPTEKICTLIHENGTLVDSDLRNLFAKSNNLKMNVDVTERFIYKFIRREPPVPYTTHFIWGFINVLKDVFQKKVTTHYDRLIEQINHVCPSWCAEARQLSEGRLNKSIRFLRKLGWIKYNSRTLEITADTTRGTKVGRMEEYLCEKFTKYYGVSPPSKEEPEVRGPSQRPLEEFYRNKDIHLVD